MQLRTNEVSAVFKCQTKYRGQTFIDFGARIFYENKKIHIRGTVLLLGLELSEIVPDIQKCSRC